MAPTSFEPHFGTNFAPTDNELKEIHELLAGPSARLAELEAEMAQKKAEYDVLAEQHAQLGREIADYRALASPMRRIPHDLLREIFYHCLPTEHNAILSHREAPILLTRVCKAWRTVTLSTPVLWASLHIPVPALSSGQYYRSDVERNAYSTTTLDVVRKRARAVREWLVRSGACGLKISLFDMEHPNPNRNVHFDMLLGTIIPLSKRWRSASFTTSSHHLRRIAALSAESVPALEELIINATSHFPEVIDGALDHVPPITWADAPLLSAPRLRRVSFINLAEDINKLPLQWQQLTHISLEGIAVGGDNFSPSNIAALLGKCPGLITARLEIVHRYDQAFFFQQLVGGNGGPLNPLHPPNVLPGPPQPVCTHPIVLPHLVELSLHNGGADLSTFFAMLHVPRLAKLEYHNYTPKQPAGEFIAFLARVSDTLISMKTDVQMFTRADLFAALKAVPRLKTLSYKRRHLMGVPNSLSSHGHGVLYFDDVFLGMLVGKRLGTVVEVPERSNANAEANAQLEEGEVSSTEEKHTADYSEVLLPELEDLECVSGVSFTDDGLLEFLKLRQNPGHTSRGGETSNSTTASTFDAQASVDNKTQIAYTRLKRLSVVFGRERNRPVLKEVQPFINERLLVDLLYPPVPLRGPFSPSDGITAWSTMSLPGFPIHPWGPF